MPIHQVTLPKLLEGSDSYLFLKWLKQEGDIVKKGEPLAEFETDKATFELESDCSGKIISLSPLKERQEMKPGEALCRIEVTELPSNRSAAPDPPVHKENESSTTDTFRKEIALALNLPLYASDKEILQAIKDLKRLKG